MFHLAAFHKYSLLRLHPTQESMWPTLLVSTLQSGLHPLFHISRYMLTFSNPTKIFSCVTPINFNVSCVSKSPKSAQNIQSHLLSVTKSPKGRKKCFRCLSLIPRVVIGVQIQTLSCGLYFLRKRFPSDIWLVFNSITLSVCIEGFMSFNA